jgi:hypothetical protein
MDGESGVESQALVKPIMVEVTLDPNDSKKLIATIPEGEKANIPAIAAAMKTGGQAGGKSRRNKKSKGGKSKKSRKSRKSLRRK